MGRKNNNNNKNPTKQTNKESFWNGNLAKSEKEDVMMYLCKPFCRLAGERLGIEIYLFSAHNDTLFTRKWQCLWHEHRIMGLTKIHTMILSHPFIQQIFLSAFCVQGIFLSAGNIPVRKQGPCFHGKHVKWPSLQGTSQSEDRSQEERRWWMSYVRWRPGFWSFQRQAPLGISCSWLVWLKLVSFGCLSFACKRVLTDTLRCYHLFCKFIERIK